MNERLHLFTSEELNGITLPSQFTFPFNYVPHPLSIIAAKHVQEHLDLHQEWQDELAKGKMMGVLVVKHNEQVGFLAAFSGNLCHSNNHPYFVPAVYDLLAEKGFFRPEEDNISAINRQISEIQNSDERKTLLTSHANTETEATAEISAYRLMMKEAKAKRDAIRAEGGATSVLIAESQFQKAELKRIQARWNDAILAIKEKIKVSDELISSLKAERQQRSAALQQLIFEHFIMLNAKRESSDLCQIFAPTPQVTPPAGAGECAAPKLLQYAYKNGLHPIAMAEFWVGASPKEVIRHHGCFYPSCKAKCEPILGWMLQGLDVEPNPHEKAVTPTPVEIVFEDSWLLVVNKPADTLTVPGKLAVDSFQEQVERLFPESEKPLITHRLDMATSGLLVFAKDKDTHKTMQTLFATRQVEKRYIAILDGIIESNEGTISLPLTIDPLNRPLQVVDHKQGKEAITHYRVLERMAHTTRMALYPVTGRTHQLRVHMAHPEGLNTPIVGDTLYGKPSIRLMLHAESITFSHPITGKTISITSKAEF